jgi:hypothetical protein
MWLLLAQKNNISIYRRELDLSPSRTILVTPDGKRIKILSGRTYSSIQIKLLATASYFSNFH